MQAQHDATYRYLRGSLLLCCFRVTAHCRKFFNSHLSAENETACQTKNIVPTVWQRANNSPDFLISRFLSLPLLKTGGRNRIETRLFVFIDTARRKRPTTIQPASLYPLPRFLPTKLKYAYTRVLGVSMIDQFRSTCLIFLKYLNLFNHYLFRYIFSRRDFETLILDRFPIEGTINFHRKAFDSSLFRSF